MFGARHVDRARSSPARPGENKAFLLTAPDERVAGRIVRALGLQQIECSTRVRRSRAAPVAGEVPRPDPVDLLVRGSDLVRARRIARRFADVDAGRP